MLGLRVEDEDGGLRVEVWVVRVETLHVQV